MGCSKSKETKNEAPEIQEQRQKSVDNAKPSNDATDENANQNLSRDDIWDDEDWANFRRKSHTPWEDPANSDFRQTLVKASQDIPPGPIEQQELAEWKAECRQRVALEEMSQTYEIEPCRYLDARISAQMKTISKMRQRDAVEEQLQLLLKEEAAAEVIGERKTLPKTLPASKQLACDILGRMAEKLAEPQSTSLHTFSSL